MKIRIVSRDHFLADGIGRHDMQMTSQIFFRERLFKILGQRTHLMCIGNKLMPLLGESDRMVDPFELKATKLILQLLYLKRDR